jgi:hypothetical protein
MINVLPAETPNSLAECMVSGRREPVEGWRASQPFIISGQEK